MALQQYQREFIEFAIGQGVLKFGEFTLKSGRVSPYFFNAGLFQSGSALARLGRCYAQAIENSGLDYDVLFGPAYKGIPLVSTTAVALADQHNKDLPWCFNRKEKKDHGEGGQLVGAPLQGKILLVDDVITAGTAIRESMELIHASNAELAGVVIALDRQEKGQGELSAVQEVARDFGAPVISVIGLSHLAEYLAEQSDKADILSSIDAYRDQYGIEVE